MLARSPITAEKNRLPGWLLHTPDTTRYDNDTEQEENETRRKADPFEIPSFCCSATLFRFFEPPTTCFLEFDDIRQVTGGTNYVSFEEGREREKLERERI